MGTMERWPLIAVPRSFTSSCRTVLTIRSGLSSAPALRTTPDKNYNKYEGRENIKKNLNAVKREGHKIHGKQ